MKLQKVHYLTLLVAAALIGLIIIQIYLLQNAMVLKRNTFEQNVNLALGDIIRKLDTREAAEKVLEVTEPGDTLFHESVVDPSESVTIIMKRLDGNETLPLPNGKSSFMPNIDIKNNKLRVKMFEPQNLKVFAMDTTGEVIANITDGFKQRGQYELEYELPNKSSKPATMNFNFFGDSSEYVVKVDPTGNKNGYSFTSGTQRKRIIHKVVDALFQQDLIPVEKRLKTTTLDSVITATLKERGIDTRFEYGVFKSLEDTVVLASDIGITDALKTTNFRRGLFPNDIFTPTEFLTLYFPGQSFYLFEQIQTSVITSIIFISIIIISFVITVRTIFNQKEFSERLKSFINNMTHEFKTPISTISLASESLQNPKNIGNAVQVERFSKIIFDENTRMRNQVEKILQMAVLENSDFELNKSEVDVHELLEEIISKMLLKIEKKKGSINTELKAWQSIVKADRVHLMNVIFNILDNALKYSQKAPEICVATENKNAEIELKIKDTGIGLSQEQQKRVFDKYYRVPTGNRHDVKGFGLGLSYVKLIIETHGGHVSVKSQSGKGSEFILSLPI